MVKSCGTQAITSLISHLLINDYNIILSHQKQFRYNSV